MKRVLAALITATLLASVLFWAESGRPPLSASTPEDCIMQMLQAAEAGDVDRYLECFTGSEREQIQRRLDGQLREDFAQSLIDAVRPLKAHAVSVTSDPRGDPDRVELSVERIYQNRNERQSYRLVRQRGAWRISEVQAAEAFQPPVPYGTPVFEEPREGGEPPLDE